MILMSLFLVLAGLLMAFNPSLFWMITERWTSSDGTEPSELYKWNTRFGGIICMIVGVGGILISVLL